jgi:PAS domain S-box-containing protein
MYYSKPREPSAAELDVLRIAGPLAAVVIQRHRDAQRLKESEERFGAIFEYSAIGMALVSLEGKWLRVNPAICRIVGYSAEELLQTDFQSITHPDDLAIDLEHVREMIEGVRPSYHLEKRYFHKAGHTIWVLLSVSLVRDGRGIPLYFISQTQDITERRRLEQSLTEIMSTEQRQLGRDLHDGLGQELTGLSLLARAFATKAERAGSPLADDARALALIATAAVATCRDIVQGVSPLTESNGGLAESLSRLVSEASNLGRRLVRFRCVGELPASLNWYTRHQLYRIAQEALNNAIAQSQADSIEVALLVEACCVRLKVASHRGEREPLQETAQTNLAMAAIRFRAAAINARISMSSQPGGGTALICEYPHDAEPSIEAPPLA